MDLRGARVLVVGSDGGLGCALVNAFQSCGADVVKCPGPSAVDGFDVTAPAARARIRDMVDGGVDVVVLAFGAVGFGLSDQTAEGSARELLDVDLLAPLLLIGELAGAVNPGGRFVVLTGAVVDVPTVGLSYYTAAKAGLSAALRVLRRELRSRRIGVLDARPPHTETGLASRPRFGQTPRLPVGLAPEVVAARIVDAVARDEDELAPSAFLAG
jgi:cyclic-di-GMP-binding biofilm dispersal mediator protein